MPFFFVIKEVVPFCGFELILDKKGGVGNSSVTRRATLFAREGYVTRVAATNRTTFFLIVVRPCVPGESRAPMQGTRKKEPGRRG